MKKIENIYYSDTKSLSQALDIYLPDSDSFPVLVYFHGGGLESHDKSEQEFFVDLQKRGICVISADYRMYPNASYPDFITDAAAAVAYAYNNISQYGTVESFFIGGSSAGAYLVQMLCFDKKYLAVHNIDPDCFDGYIMNAGQPTAHFRVLTERGIDGRRIIVDETAPLYHICGERNYPPMKIIVSDNDMENRYEQTLLLISTLKHFGFEDKVDFRVMENTTHCSYKNEKDAEGNYIFADILYDFIKKHTNGGNK